MEDTKIVRGPWTAQEDDRIKTAGISNAALSEELNRTIKAVELRKYKLKGSASDGTYSDRKKPSAGTQKYKSKDADKERGPAAQVKKYSKKKDVDESILECAKEINIYMTAYNIEERKIVLRFLLDMMESF